MTRGTLFLKNYTQNLVKKPLLDPFLKNQNWAYLWTNSLKFNTACFYCIPSWGLSKYIETKLQTTLFFHVKLFENTKRGFELVSLPHFLHYFWRKIFILLYSINWPNFIVWLPSLRKILGNKCIVIVF